MPYEEKGILVEQVVQAEKNKRPGNRVHERTFLCVRFLYLCLASFGVALALTGTFQVNTNLPLLLFGVFVICLFYTAAWQISAPKGIQWIVLFVLAAAAVFLLRGSIFRGLAGCYNLYADQSNQYYGAKLALIDAGTVSSTDTLLGILALMIVFSGLLSLCIIHLIDGRVVALISVAPFALALAVGKVPPMGSVLLSAFAIIGVLFLQYTKHQENLRISTVTVRMGNAVLSRLRWQTAAVAGAFFLIIGTIGYFALGPAITTGYESQESLREDIRDGNLLRGMQNFWKKLTRGEWDWLPFDIIRSSGVHGGKLSNVKEIRDYDETHLYMDISGGLKAPIYIKAYVGSNYTGSGWKELDSSMNQSGLATGMDTVTLAGQYYDLLGSMYQSGAAAVAKRDYVITLSEANSLYNYIPYGSDLSGYTAGTPFDAYLKEETDRQIISMYYLNTQRASNINLLADAGAVQPADQTYYLFAQSVYTRIPTEGLERFYQEYSGRSFENIGEMVTFIRDSLASHGEYTKAPGATPRKKDYVEYFLYEGHKGFCTQFASAAVLMFRMYGIPARYVEGYFITELDDVQGAEEIKDSRAHAWPEIYLQGVGWIPVEVTPGFISDEDLLDQNESEDLTKSDVDDVTNPPEETPAAETESSLDLQETTEAPAPETRPEGTTVVQQEQTREPDGGNGTDGDGSGGGFGLNFDWIWKLLLWIILPLLLLIVILLIIWAQYRRRMAQQRRRMKGKPDEAMRYILNRTDDILEAEGLPSCRDAALSDEVRGLLSNDVLARMHRLDQELTFSRHTFTEQQRDELRKEYMVLAEKVMQGKKLPGRLWYRYGKCFA